jgi:RNA polymerase sigma-70 factor, ECF subfamily
VGFGAHFQGALAEAQKGAEWAVESLYREFHPSLLRYLRAQEPSEGEDLASEVWLDAGAALGRFRGDERAFQRWLFTIAHRRLIDFRRRRSRSASSVGGLDAFTQIPGSEDLERQLLATSETEAALARLAALPPDQADVILLRVVAGLDVADVAEILGKKPGTVRVLQHRGLQLLAEQLAPERRSVTG